jgi:hypothetical protein
VDDIETRPQPSNRDLARRGRTIVIRCWPEDIAGEPPLLRGTIRDLSRSGHIAFEGINALNMLVRHLLADLADDAAVGRKPHA